MRDKNNTTTDKNADHYGLAYQRLQTELMRLEKVAEMRLSTYLAYRMGVEGWTFSAAEITKQTRISKKTALKLCHELVRVGIFTVKSFGQGSNLTLYDFDKTLLEGYLKGGCALNGLAKVAKPVIRKKSCKVYEYQQVSSGSGGSKQEGNVGKTWGNRYTMPWGNRYTMPWGNDYP